MDIGMTKAFKIFLAVAVFGFAFFVFSKDALAKDYYASPVGGGNGLSENSPFQIADFWPLSKPGDTLYLLDGVYQGSNSMLSPLADYHYEGYNLVCDSYKGGQEDQFIKIKSLVDGRAIIDGQKSNKPLVFNCQKYIDVEGIVFKNPALNDAQAIGIFGSHYINLRRVSAYNTIDAFKSSPILIYQSSSNILVEDCIASGENSRTQINIYGCENVTVRRCYTKFKYSNDPDSPGGSGIVFYGSANGLGENNVHDNDDYRDTWYAEQCISSWTAEWNEYSQANNTRIYGDVCRDVKYHYAIAAASVKYEVTGGHWKDNVVIRGLRGFSAMGIKNLLVEKNTFHVSEYNDDTQRGITGYFNSTTKVAGYGMSVESRNNNLMAQGSGDKTGIWLQNSPYLLSFDHYFNNIYNYNENYYGTAAGHGETSIDPQYNTNKYGDGAYLIRSGALRGKGCKADAFPCPVGQEDDIGAEVLYRYVDGVITSVPLWPWPMEDRIKNETGVSVTWEANGGLWKTLDCVYDNCDTTPPSAPSGLTVQ